jgi:hypothetical protein
MVTRSGLSDGATASSRSMTTMSAPEDAAFAKRSGRLPGTNRKDLADLTSAAE